MSEKSPWLTIWTEPRETIRRIIAENPKRSLWLLAAIYGFSSLLNSFQSGTLGVGFGIIPLVVFAFVLAPFWGYAVFALWSWVILWTGKLFKGQGNFQTVRAAYAWSCVPLTVNGILWLLLILFFGRSLFASFPQEHLLTGAETLLLFCALIAKLVLLVWSIVIYLNTLSEVQRFSILRAIGNVILTALIIGIVFGLLFGMGVRMLGVALEPSESAFQLMQNLEIMKPI